MAAAVRTPSGAPPMPITACTPDPTTAAAMPAERSPSPINRMRAPVAEVVGWTIFDGRQQVVGPSGFYTQSAAGTIANASLGLRVGLGDRADIYAGYSHCFTGPAWFRDMARVELRLFF